jgi:hypothetical protein
VPHARRHQADVVGVAQNSGKSADRPGTAIFWSSARFLIQGAASGANNEMIITFGFRGIVCAFAAPSDQPKWATQISAIKM